MDTTRSSSQESGKEGDDYGFVSRDSVLYGNPTPERRSLYLVPVI